MVGRAHLESMSYDPATHLVYIRCRHRRLVNLADKAHAEIFDGFYTTNGIFPDDSYVAADLKRLYGPLPELKQLIGILAELIRLDPIAGKIVWSMRLQRHAQLDAASRPPRQPRIPGRAAEASDLCGRHRSAPIVETGSHIMAAPTTYSVKASIRRSAGGYGAPASRRAGAPQSATNNTST